MQRLDMPDDEIRTKYKNMAGSPQERVEIISQLNATNITTTKNVKPIVIEILGDLIPPEMQEHAKSRYRYGGGLFQLLYNQGLSDSEISQQTGAAYDTVWRWRRRNGLGVNKPRYTEPTPQMLAERRKLYEQGLNDRQIAEIQGVCSDSVGKWRRGLGLECNRRRRRKG